MEPVTINNPVFNDQLAGQLAGQGYVWLSVGLTLFNMVIFPIAMFIFKNWQQRQTKHIEDLNIAQNRIIDLETKNRTMVRDNQMKAFDNRISHLEKDNDRKIDDMSKQVEKMNSTMNRLFEKFDKMTEKMEELVIRLVKIEK